jgi:hypothetical protein
MQLKICFSGISADGVFCKSMKINGLWEFKLLAHGLINIFTIAMNQVN